MKEETILEKILKNVLDLRQEVAILIKKDEEVHQKLSGEKKVEKPKPLGEWIFYKRKSGKKGNKYWYLGRKDKKTGKLELIYIGKDEHLPQAEKILADRLKEKPEKEIIIPKKPEKQKKSKIDKPKPQEIKKPAEKPVKKENGNGKEKAFQEKLEEWKKLPLQEKVKITENLKQKTMEILDSIDTQEASTEKEKDSRYRKVFKDIMVLNGWNFVKMSVDTYRRDGNQFELSSDSIGLLRRGVKKKKQKIVIKSFSPQELSNLIEVSLLPVTIISKTGKTSQTLRFD